VPTVAELKRRFAGRSERLGPSLPCAYVVVRRVMDLTINPGNGLIQAMRLKSFSQAVRNTDFPNQPAFADHGVTNPRAEFCWISWAIAHRLFISRP
jgi:hypothetical protein